MILLRVCENLFFCFIFFRDEFLGKSGRRRGFVDCRRYSIRWWSGGCFTSHSLSWRATHRSSSHVTPISGELILPFESYRLDPLYDYHLNYYKLLCELQVTVVRSPDGLSKTWAMGSLSIQRAAVWVLQHYYAEFPLYNPHLDRLPPIRKRHPSINNSTATSFKFYDFDGISSSFTPVRS